MLYFLLLAITITVVIIMMMTITNTYCVFIMCETQVHCTALTLCVLRPMLNNMPNNKYTASNR